MRLVRLDVRQLTRNRPVANVVLESAYERIIVEDVYGDIPLGVYVIRGENIVIMGEVVSSNVTVQVVLDLAVNLWAD